jgi:8-oxo-dGTP pyrophosphatase MutT (NUDIX family)
MLPVEADGSIIISFGERMLHFTHTAGDGWYCVDHLDKESISRAKIVHFLETYKQVAILSCDPMASFLEFAEQFAWVEAAGGVVENESGEVVMIRRNERWDLPKGHREKGETMEQCAAREAEEETGVKVERVERLLTTTLHAYNIYGGWELKLTVWYAMEARRVELKPQSEEGIVAAEWVAGDDIEQRIKGSFPTIKRVFAAFL